MGKYKVWQITATTKFETDVVNSTTTKRITKKNKSSDKYLYDVDDLEKLRSELVEKYECTLVSLNYDSV